jgi:acyl-CoA thioesterase I
VRESIQNPVTPALVGVTVLVIVLSIFVWAWAVRRPAPASEAVGQPQATLTEVQPITYAAIGASDVVGVGAADPSAQSWVNVLHGYMPQGTRFVRLGRSGITLQEANEVEVPEAVEAKPDLVTLWNAVNDATQGVPLNTYRDELEKALGRLTEETPAQVIILNVPDVTVLMNGVSEEERALVQGGVVQWNKAIDEVASRYTDRVTVVDLFPVSGEVLDHPEYISPDNFHLSTSGYERLAQIVWQTIERDSLLRQ